MRIVSLLPSATEIAFALGLDDDVVGVSCDCDYPDEARAKPVVSHTALKVESSSPGDIDAEVRGSVAASESIYRLDRDLIRSLRPDLILAQDLCRVCAVPSGHVTEALETIGCKADVISLDPHSLDEVIEGISEVARAASSEGKGARIVAGLRARVEAVRDVASGLLPVSAFALEWADPPFSGGHWIPEMIRVAGGKDVLGIEGAPSRTLAWSEIAEAEPEVIVFMPCGYGLQEAIEQAAAFADNASLMATPAARSGSVFAVDGSAYFSRPGPRLVDGLELLAWILHPEAFAEPPAGRVARVDLGA